MKRNNLVEIISCSLTIASLALLLIFIIVRNEYGLAIALAVNLICLLFNVIKSLIKKEPNSWFDWVETGLSFILTIIIVIAFAAASPLEIKDAVVQVTAAVIGGSLTLYGVGISIKYARIEKEKDEIKKAKPVVFPISDVTWASIPKEKRNNIYIEINNDASEIKRSKRKNVYNLYPFYIANSDASLCGLYGILINNKLIKFEYEQIMAKNSYNLLIFESTSGYHLDLEEEIASVSILLVDMLGNIYECVARFEVNEYKEIKINAFLRIELIK